tara:strand:- start:240 stop:497 length:258 start_codon:yes stop_codon:yes gene_type:complete
VLYLVLAVALAGDAPDPIPAMDDAIVAADEAIAAQQDIMELLEHLAAARAPAPDVVDPEPIAAVEAEELADSDSPGLSPLLAAVE